MKQEIYKITLLALLSLFLISSCTLQTGSGGAKIEEAGTMQENDEAMVEKGSSMDREDVSDDEDAMIDKSNNTMIEDQGHIEDNEMMEEGYTGQVFAGTATKFIDFNKQDYDKAVSNNKIILLYFYAEWCPSCRAELPEINAAFDELEREDLVGFRVNYRDSNVDEYEENLAAEHGITYQHTKVIIKDGERILKAPNSWDKEKYLEEIAKV